jgi:carbon starvation protein
LISIIAVITLFPSVEEFRATYSSFVASNGAGLGAFIEGATVLASGLMIPPAVASTIVSIIVVSFAATTLDTSVRLMRYIISELGVEYKIPALEKKHVATSIAVGASAALVLIPEGPQGFGSGGYLLWPLFGTANQLLAGISLLLISIWLRKLGRNYMITIIPMIFLMFMTLYAMFRQVFLTWAWYASQPNMLLFVFGAIIFVFTLWIILTAFQALVRKVDPDFSGDDE